MFDEELHHDFCFVSRLSHNVLYWYVCVYVCMGKGEGKSALLALYR